MLNSRDYDGLKNLTNLLAVLRRHALLFIAVATIAFAPFVYYLVMRSSQYRIETFFNLSAETFMNQAAREKKEEHREAFSQIIIDQPVEKPFVFRVRLGLFKKLTSQIENPYRLDRYNQTAGILSPEEFREFERYLRRKGIEAVFRPVYDFSREDLKEIAQFNREEITSVIGIKMVGESFSADRLKKIFFFLGRYAKDSIAVLMLYDFFLEKSFEAELTSSRIENDLMQARFAIAQMEKLRAELKEILDRYPDAAGFDNRQVLDLRNGAYRFLSPTIQLVGLESHLAEIKGNIDANERERDKFAIVKKFIHTGRQEVLSMMESGVVDLKKLDGLLSSVYDGLDMNSDAVRGAYNLLKVPVDILIEFINTNYRFLTEPTPVPKSQQSENFIILVFGLLASVSAAFFCVVVFDFLRPRPPLNSFGEDVLLKQP